MSENTITWDQDADGVVTLTLDDPSQRANTMTPAYQESMAAAVDRLYTEKDSMTGVIVTSAKSTFFAGGELTLLSQVTDDNVIDFANPKAQFGLPEVTLGLLPGGGGHTRSFGTRFDPNPLLRKMAENRENF